MPEPILLLIGLVAAGVLVLGPLWRRGDGSSAIDDDREAAMVRHRVALEALRDVETDRRAGSLDEATYAEQLADAEARAAVTRAGLAAQAPEAERHADSRFGGRALGAGLAALIAVALLAGSLLPATGLGNATVVNEQLAVARDAEAARQDRITALLDRLAADTQDAQALSDLADAYLAGSSQDDLVRAAVALQLLLNLEPERADAYERIVTVYLRAGDYANARAALDGYAATPSADPVELAFFEGLITLRGEDDPAAAQAAFDRFLELAPDDPRAGMVRRLRDEASPGP
ncbi:MAG TPA: hypothetical protein VGA26_03595 [Candidatus Limnocylindria bacterium]